MIVIAEELERKLIDTEDDVLVTGVGGLNIIASLKDLDRDTPITNIGYAGSNSIPRGTICTVSKVGLYHPNVQYQEPLYTLNGDFPCYTSNDFVLQTDVTEPCLFDMELAYILALGFTNVQAIKVVSDNLSMEEYRDGNQQ